LPSKAVSGEGEDWVTCRKTVSADWATLGIQYDLAGCDI